MVICPEVEKIAAVFDAFPVLVDAVRGTVGADVEVWGGYAFGGLEGVRVADLGCAEEGAGDGVAAAEVAEGLGVLRGKDEEVCLEVAGGEAGGVGYFVGAGEEAGVHCPSLLCTLMSLFLYAWFCMQALDIQPRVINTQIRGPA